MASVTDEMRDFVRDALIKGESRESISAALQSAGWPEAQVARALEAYASTDFPLPIPRPRSQVSAREAFIYLLLYTTLLICAVQFGSLLFSLIDTSFPDALDPDYRVNSRDSSMRFAISSLVVAFPLFLFLSRVVAKSVQRNPAVRLSWVRKWLTYLALFVAATILMGDIIFLLSKLLDGDLTTRFVLKSATVGLISGCIFGYYFLGLQQEEKERASDL